MTGGCPKSKAEVVELKNDCLNLEVSEIRNEGDKTVFTVHTKTTLPGFAKSQFSVVRQHGEFIWLHDYLEENEYYAGYVIPPAPPTPDFDTSKKNFHKLNECKNTVTEEEYARLHQEVEMEIVATLRKTSTMHEVFLQRLANHSVFRNDYSFHTFLEYDQDLFIRNKTQLEKVRKLLNNSTNLPNDVVLANAEEKVDEFFEQEKHFLLTYYSHIKDVTLKSDCMTKHRKNIASSYNRISSALSKLASIDAPELQTLFSTVSETFEEANKIEKLTASDEDLKLSDTLRYYMRDAAACKDLLYRRLASLLNYEAAYRNLKEAQTKNKDIAMAEKTRKEARQKFESISQQAKQELQDLKMRRVLAFQRNFIELTKLKLEHAKSQIKLFETHLMSLREEH